MMQIQTQLFIQHWREKISAFETYLISSKMPVSKETLDSRKKLLEYLRVL